MQIKSRFSWIICVVLILLACWLFFKMVDLSVTIDHQEQHAKVILNQRNLLVHLLNSIYITESESKIREILDQFAGDSLFQKGSSEVIAEQVSFVFKDGKLVRIHVGNDNSE